MKNKIRRLSLVIYISKGRNYHASGSEVRLNGGIKLYCEYVYVHREG